MAAPIVIQAELATSDIERGFRVVEQRGKKAVDTISNYAEQAARRFADALGGGNAKAGFDKFERIRKTFQARDISNENQHQRRLTEIRERAASQQATIETRKLAQIDAIKARQLAAEARHQQKLLEIQTRGANDGYGKLIGLATRFLTITAAIGAATKAVNAAITLDSARRALTAVTGSAQLAEEQIKRLREIAKLPGIDFEGAIRGATRLQAVGFSARESERALKAFANAVALTGGGADQLREITVQLGQLSAKGKVLAQDLRPIIEAAPIVGKVLKDAFGTVDSKQLSDALQKAGVDSKQFIEQILVPSLERLRRVAAGPKESFENLQIAATLALARIGEPLLRNVLPVVERLIPLIESLADKFGKLSPTTQDAVLAATAFTFIARPLFGLISGGVGIVTALAGAYRTLAASIIAANVASAGSAGAAAAGGGVAGAAAAGGLTGLLARFGFKAVIGGLAAGTILQSGSGGPRATQLRREADARELAARRAAGQVLEFGPQAQESSAAAAAAREAERRRIAASAALDALIDQVRRNIKGDGGEDEKGAKAAASRARAIRQSELSLARSDLQNELKLFQDFADEQLRTLEASHAAGLVSTREYYDNRFLLVEAKLQKEVALIIAQAEATEAALGKARKGSPEAIKLQEKLNDLYADGQRKVAALTNNLTDNAAAYRKALGELNPGNLTQLEVKELPLIEQFEKLPPIFQKARLELQALREQIFLTTSGAGIASDPGQFAGQSSRGELVKISELRDIELRIEEVKIQNAITAGVISEVEGRKQLLAVQRQYGEQIIAALESERKLAEIESDPERAAQLQFRIESLRTLGLELDNSSRFIRGFGSEIELVGDIFERFGRAVSGAFRNVTDLFNNLKNAVKNFFLDLLGNTLQSLVGGTLKNLFSGLTGNTAAGGANGARGGGFSLGNLFGGFGGFGGGIGPGGTAPFNPNSNPLLKQLSGLNFGITVPSLSGGGGAAAGGGAAKATGLLGLLGSTFKGIGFGLKPGSAAGSLAAALPLLGVGLGSQLGGGSLLGQIAGGIGGGLLGIGLTAAPGAIAAGGSLAGLGFLAPLFSNPFTAIAGAALLAGAVLLGKAKQRKKDEAASGDFLTDAIRRIRELKTSAEAGQLTSLAEARKIFENEILGTFIAQINTIKTKSVRESRLTNQTRDLRNLFEAEVVPAVIAASTANKRFRRQIPEFATGGITRGGLAFLHDKEAILNQTQQARLFALTHPNILKVIGVPDAPSAPVTGTPQFATGGVFTAPVASVPTFVFENVTLMVGEGDSTRIVGAAVKTPDGKRHVYGVVEEGRRNNGF